MDATDVLRTPDPCFDHLPGYDFSPHYLTVEDPALGPLRLHYLDEGPAAGPLVLCLHGEPSWCYLYRKMIPLFTAAGLRVLAPDLIGFGRSDKPAARDAYSYQSHVDWMSQWMRALDIRDATLLGQDWGGLIGLRLVAENPTRFARISLSNTGLPTGDQAPGKAFMAWCKFSQEDPDFDIGLICNEFGRGALSDAEIEAYRAPFPDDSYKAGARQFPLLVPVSKDDPARPANLAAWEVLRRWEKPVLLCYSDGDPVTAGADQPFRENIPGATGQPHITLKGGHFIQNTDGERWARAVVSWLEQ